jgi:hypothetical protein
MPFVRQGIKALCKLDHELSEEGPEDGKKREYHHHESILLVLDQAEHCEIGHDKDEKVRKVFPFFSWQSSFTMIHRKQTENKDMDRKELFIDCYMILDIFYVFPPG